jgi:hypothetical protein
MSIALSLKNRFLRLAIGLWSDCCGGLRTLGARDGEADHGPDRNEREEGSVHGEAV